MGLAALADRCLSPAALAAAFGVALVLWLLAAEEGDIRRGAPASDPSG